MKILLDEDVPEQVITVLQHVLRGHHVDHVTRIGWSGKQTRSCRRTRPGESTTCW